MPHEARLRMPRMGTRPPLRAETSLSSSATRLSSSSQLSIMASTPYLFAQIDQLRAAPGFVAPLGSCIHLSGGSCNPAPSESHQREGG